jgi:hypothetical protein
MKREAIMHLEDFYNRLQSHKRLTCSGVVREDNPAGDYFVVEDRESRAAFKVMVDTVLEREWDVLESILTCHREPLVLEHVTRIVGYFSKVKNWNKSKLGELRDRRAGNYRLDRIQPEIVEEAAPYAAVEGVRDGVVATA